MTEEKRDVEETKQEQVGRLKKAALKKRKSLPIAIMESQLYDWDTTTRMTLLVLALGMRTNPEAWVQEDCPWNAEEMLGWCDFAQWRIALRAGKSEDRIQKILAKLEADGVIVIERWMDSNKANHDRYRIVEEVIRDNQRPAQKRGVERPPRYKMKSSNRGRFTSENQPNRASAVDILGVGGVMVEVEEL